MGRIDVNRARGEMKDMKVVLKQSGFAGTYKKKILFKREEALVSSSIKQKTLSEYEMLLRVKKLHHFNWLPERSVFYRFNTYLSRINMVDLHF